MISSVFLHTISDTVLPIEACLISASRTLKLALMQFLHSRNTQTSYRTFPLSFNFNNLSNKTNWQPTAGEIKFSRWFWCFVYFLIIYFRPWFMMFLISNCLIAPPPSPSLLARHMLAGCPGADSFSRTNSRPEPPGGPLRLNQRAEVLHGIWSVLSWVPATEVGNISPPSYHFCCILELRWSPSTCTHKTFLLLRRQNFGPTTSAPWKVSISLPQYEMFLSDYSLNHYFDRKPGSESEWTEY